ncbi:hypothetical protein Tco_1060862, partial [Tanacetum coccineum]
VKDKPQPVSEFNPTTGIQVLNKATAVADKPTNVVKGKVDAVKPLVVKDKVKDKVPVKKSVAVVKKSVTVVVKDPAVLVKEKDKENAPIKDKDKAHVSVIKATLIVSENMHDDVVKEKSADKGKKSGVKGKDMAPTDISKDKPKNNVSVIVTKRCKTELPKDKPKDKHKAHSEVPVAEKSIVVSDKIKPKCKQNVFPTVQTLSKVLILRSSMKKVKPQVKSKAAVGVLRSKETPVKRKRILSKEDDSKKKAKGKSKKEDSNDSELETGEVVSSDEVDCKPKKLKLKGGLNRKRNGSDYDSFDEDKIRRLVNILKKKVKKEEFDEEIVPKNSKKKETAMT